MHIKQIVLDGFKSYGQRTEISGFDPLFNAITGLNGSGKSNILDAICFVLGITNLTHVRANSLQDLIFKNGQAGVNKATVSIIFDNRNPTQSPSGFENADEITITRQIALGGKNKYMINGINVTSKRVQDFFCSVQLNVNSPHFLIMQGRITKILNMKPLEILSMVEEAAGTKMYEAKRQNTQKLIDKKDSRLTEFQAIINQDLSPKLEKLKAEREQYREYQRTERELEHLMGIFQAWQYFQAKRALVQAQQALDDGQQQTKNIEETIEQNKESVKELEAEIENISTNNKSESSKELQEAEARLKAKEKQEAKLNASVKSIKDDITMELNKKKQLEKGLSTDKKGLTAKEDELNKVKSLFETLKDNDKKDREALALAEKKYEALCAGMEVNDQGVSETLAEQLMNAKAEALRVGTEGKQAAMQIAFCENQLKTLQNQVGTSSTDYEKDKANLQKNEKEVAKLEASVKSLNFSEERIAELHAQRRALNQETRNLRDRVENFEATKPQTAFKYRDPETNFNRSTVKGVVCKLIECRDDTYATALETAAGGKLYNVVVDTDTTGKKLLQRGDLQTRTTFIPLNKISAHKMDQGTINFAQNLVGKENCQPALSLINYDRSLQGAMEFIYGNVFICKDINVAKRVTFHDRIKKRCVTLDGDSTDPSGTLSGGARQKGEPILRLIQNIKAFETQLKEKDEQLKQIDQKIRQMSASEEQYNALKYKLDIAKHEVNLLKERLHNTSFAIKQGEIDTLKAQIAGLNENVKTCQATEKTCNSKVKELETKMKDSSGYKKKRLEEAEAEMNKAKEKADKSKNEWQEREQYYEMLILQIEEIKKGLVETEEQITLTEQNIKKLQEQCDKVIEDSNNVKGEVAEIQDEVNRFKALMAEKNSELQGKVRRKEALLAQNVELELEIKKSGHQIKELTNAYKHAKHRESECSKKIKDNNYLEKGEALSQKEGHDLERKIKIAQEKKLTLGRTVNAEAQGMFDVVEKKFNDIVKKQKVIQIDRLKLVKVINELDEKKENALKLAFAQVSKDFGSIFATLLPGANAKLVTVQGRSILQGLEIKVSLGNVWKENLTELSGGQRSLAGLSLILAMLLFKPAPLYILDEVDAALDLSHTQNIGAMLRGHFKKSQFIVVSLKDGMFNNANVLFRTKFIDGVSAVQRTENTRRG